jgi:predicted secreted protein
MKKINNLFKFSFAFMFILMFCGCSSEEITFEIILETDIESGYEWNSTESKNVNLISNMNMIDDNNIDNLGIGGVSIFKYEVIDKENITVEFNYCNEQECLYNIKYEIENKNNKLKLLNKEGSYFTDKIIPDPSFT